MHTAIYHTIPALYGIVPLASIAVNIAVSEASADDQLHENCAMGDVYRQHLKSPALWLSASQFP